jgi:hypothetical protein
MVTSLTGVLGEALGDAPGVLWMGLAGELCVDTSGLEWPFCDALSRGDDIGFATRGVCGLDSVATGRPVPGELGGTPTGLGKRVGEGLCVGAFAVGPSATLGRFSGVKGRLVSLRRAVDREKGLILLGDAFPILPAADV